MTSTKTKLSTGKRIKKLKEVIDDSCLLIKQHDKSITEMIAYIENKALQNDVHFKELYDKMIFCKWYYNIKMESIPTEDKLKDM